MHWLLYCYSTRFWY